MPDQSEWPSFLEWLPDDLYAWEAAVAIGTIAAALATVSLAIATFRLAGQTRRDVDASTQSALASQRSVEVAERSFAAGIRPILAGDDRVVVQKERGTLVGIIVSLRNVGSGLALVSEGPELILHGDKRPSWRSTPIANWAVPAGEQTRSGSR